MTKGSQLIDFPLLFFIVFLPLEVEVYEDGDEVYDNNVLEVEEVDNVYKLDMFDKSQ